MKKVALLFLITCLFVVTQSAQATISVAFTAGNTRGCDSLFTYFSPTVTGCSGTVSYVWTFSHPSSSFSYSSSASSYTFSRLGYWDVTVMAVCGTDTAVATRSGYIHITPSPAINFYASDSGTISPRTVYFTNISSADTTCSGYSWTWTISGPASATYHTRDISYYFSTPGTYSVSLLFNASSCGCFGSEVKSAFITIGSTLANSSILPNPSRVSITPNPSSDNIDISADEPINTIAIINLLGQQVFSAKQNGNTKETVNISGLPVGVYYVKVNGSTMVRLLKN